jgi:hypothetical protein
MTEIGGGGPEQDDVKVVRQISHADGFRIYFSLIFQFKMGGAERDNNVTCRPIARKRAGKHVSVEMDSWKPTRYGATFPWIRGTGDHKNISVDTKMKSVFCQSDPLLYNRKPRLSRRSSRL